MNFFNPLAFVGLISIPIIIIMYLLKQNHKEVKVSSIQLWKKAIIQSESQQPWQKLRKNILMILQILIATLLVLAMTKPYIMGIGKIYNYIFVLDNSMSMQATGQTSNNRFDEAKESLNKFIDGIEPNSKMSLIVMNNNPYTAFNAIENKNTAKNIINDIKVSSSNADLDMTNSILEMLYNENKGNIYIFSDNLYNFEKLDTETIFIGQSAENTAITLVSYSNKDENTDVLVKVKNYGQNSVEQSVSIYVDELIYDTKEIRLDAYEEKDISFDSLSVKGTNLEARLEQKDILTIDDVGFNIILNNKNKKVLLVSEQNIFLEKALSILDVELYKSSDIEDLKDYNLYIFDGILPQKLPTDGHILIINPPDNNSLIPVGQKLEVNNITIKNKNLLKFISDINFSVKETKKIEIPEWSDIIIDSDVAPLMLMGEKNNQKIVIFNFDLHFTDFPLKKEFPIFIYNLINWYIPENIVDTDKIIVGDIINFDLQPDINSAKVINPDGEIIDLVPLFPVAPFSETYKSGIYTLEQTADDNTTYSNFAVNVPIDESNLLRDKLTTQTLDKLDIQSNKNIIHILIIISLIILILEWYLYGNKNSLFKKRIIATTRLITIVLVILSLFDLSIKKSSNQATSIFAVDLSDSVIQNIDGIKTFITDALPTKTKNDFVGVVSFAEYPAVESGVSKEIDMLSFNSQINKGITNIDSGLKLSSVIMPEFSSKRIILISDGQENAGNILQQAKLLKQQNIKLDVYPLKNNIDKEVQLTEIIVPPYINKNTKLNIEIKIDSLNDTNSVLKLYKNNKVVSQENINIYKGENKFIFADTADMGGSVIYKAELEAQTDTLIQNNTAYAHSYVSDIPQILILDNNNSGIEIEKILSNSQVNVVRQNSLIPIGADKLSTYNAVILTDLSIDMLPKEFPDILENYVKSRGGGLLVTGGINSYALGGYQNTPLERILPIDMQLKDKTKEGNLGIIIVTDRSGSMDGGEYGISKLSLAKEAVIRAVDSLETKDSVGIIAFDDKPQWIADFQQIGENKQTIQNNIAGITSGGGTTILPSLALAYDTLSKADTKLKHIILMTDGQAETSGYDSLIKNMADNNITLSTVAVGSDSDTRLLEKLAKSGNGRYYYSNVFTDLPEIFAKETLLAGSTYINNRSFYPNPVDSSIIMENINQLPILNGYVASTAKPIADIILNSDKDEPILATWQYGLGKSAAWTSDIDGRWSSNWLASQEGIEIIRNTISWILKSPVTGDVLISGDKNNIKATITSHKNIRAVKGTIINPDMKEYPIELKATQPGIFETKFDAATTGAYTINLQIEKENGDIEFVNSGMNINYSSEYDIRTFSEGEDLLKKASEITGGRILNSPNEIFELQQPKSYNEKNITIVLLIIALLLLMFEIALRRFPILTNKLELTVNNISLILKNDIIKKKPSKTKKIKKADKIVETKQINSTSSTLVAKKKKRIGR